jgi:electron transfer flavoprotein beta subunit
MKAKKKPLDTTTLDALGISAGQLIKTVKTDPPPQRQKGVMVKDVGELFAVLKKKGLL